MTEHFTLAELLRSEVALAKGIANVPSDPELLNLKRLADMLERIRAHLGGVPMIIHSAYRSSALNKAVGGTSNSDHVRGMAADFSAPKFGSPYRIARALAPVRDALAIGQIIYESVGGKQWVHVSTRAPEKVLNAVITVNDSGTFLGIKEGDA